MVCTYFPTLSIVLCKENYTSNPAFRAKYTNVPQEISVQIPTPQLTKIGAVVLEMKLAEGRKILYSMSSIV
jgi:hypothetical protein